MPPYSPHPAAAAGVAGHQRRGRRRSLGRLLDRQLGGSRAGAEAAAASGVLLLRTVRWHAAFATVIVCRWEPCLNPNPNPSPSPPPRSG